MEKDNDFEMFFIKEGETQCLNCEAHYPKNIKFHACSIFNCDKPQVDIYFLESGKEIRRNIFFRKRIIYFEVKIGDNFEIYFEFKIPQSSLARSDQKKIEED